MYFVFLCFYKNEININKKKGILSVATTKSAFELESDLQDTVECTKKWLVDFNAGQTQLVSFDQSMLLL